MDLPRPPATAALVAVAAYVRERLAAVPATLAPLVGRGDPPLDQAVLATARQLGAVIVGAAGPFAPNAYSRTRLVRQLHASGLLSGDETRRTVELLELDAASGGGTPR